MIMIISRRRVKQTLSGNGNNNVHFDKLPADPNPHTDESEARTSVIHHVGGSKPSTS